MKRSVLVVDDFDGYRTQVRALLEAGDYEVVGEADDGGSGIAEAARLAPELVLLDVQLPDMSGFDVARRVRQQAQPAPHPVIILISSRDRGDYGARVDQSGADGFITKSEMSLAAVATILNAQAR